MKLQPGGALKDKLALRLASPFIHQYNYSFKVTRKNPYLNRFPI